MYVLEEIHENRLITHRLAGSRYPYSCLSPTVTVLILLLPPAQAGTDLENTGRQP